MTFPLNYLILFFAIILIGCNSSNDAKKKILKKDLIEKIPHQLTSEEVAGGWELLFDGKRIEHWRSYNSDTLPNQGWYIDVEKNLVVEKGGGDLVTKRKFENFDLKIDFQLSELSNSGIFYRVLEKSDTAIWCNAIEYQLLDAKILEKSNDLLLEKHATGDVYDLISANYENKISIGKWNQARIIVLNNYVEHWLNGKLILEYKFDTDDWQNLISKSKFRNYPNFGKTTVGNIGLQEHGNVVKFRNLKIKEL
ncbi:MAG: DUF1080 domain-containing protein [Saprospiraceae bacterium]